MSLCNVMVIISFLDVTNCSFLLFPPQKEVLATVFKTEIPIVESNFEIKIETSQSLLRTGQQAVSGKARMISGVCEHGSTRQRLGPEMALERVCFSGGPICF